jgi:hypothetical protein
VSRLLPALGVVLLVAGCSSGSEPAEEPGPASAPQASGGGTATDPAPPPQARCPVGMANCREASGRILYVERVDPDGDGDAHFVLLSPQGVTAPGLTIVDVKRSLRPSPLPGPGERLSAAGPVHRGSHGQRQIEAIELRSGSG